MEALQKELAQAVSLATKFQEKNEKLETELTNYSRFVNYKKKKQTLVMYNQLFLGELMNPAISINKKWRN